MQRYTLNISTIKEVLTSQGLDATSINPFPTSGQRQVFNVKFADGKESILKFIDITPYEAIDTQHKNTHYGKALEEEEFNNLKHQEIEKKSQRIKRELKAAKEVDIFPQFEIFNELQIYRLDQIVFLYYFEKKIEGTPLKYSKCYTNDEGLNLDEVLIFVREMLNLVKEMYVARTKYVHRDITPANIIIDNKNKYHLIDAGLVKSSEDETITRHEAAIGTKRYRAPEQESIIEHYEWDYRTDLFPIGLIAIELFLPKARILTEDELRDLQEIFEIWKEKDGSLKSKRFFSKVIVKLSNLERVRRANGLENLLNEINLLLKGEI